MQSDKLVTLATFGTVEEAHLAKNFLEAEGVRAFLADEASVGNLWQLGNAFGGVKLCVSDADLEHAERLLDRHDAEVAQPSSSITEKPTAQSPGEPVEERITAVQPVGEPSGPEDELPEPESEGPEDELEPPFAPGEVMATRAFRTAVIGFFFLPITFYSVWVLIQLFFWQGELTPAGGRKALFAVLINCFAGFFYWVVFIAMGFIDITPSVP